MSGKGGEGVFPPPEHAVAAVVRPPGARGTTSKAGVVKVKEEREIAPAPCLESPFQRFDVRLRHRRPSIPLRTRWRTILPRDISPSMPLSMQQGGGSRAEASSPRHRGVTTGARRSLSDDGDQGGLAHGLHRRIDQGTDVCIRPRFHRAQCRLSAGDPLRRWSTKCACACACPPRITINLRRPFTRAERRDAAAEVELELTCRPARLLALRMEAMSSRGHAPVRFRASVAG
jgi:hypothetical protein